MVRFAARTLTLASGLAAAIPVIASTEKAVRAGWLPAGDDGIIATRSFDVPTSHKPLVGQYSEAGLVIHGQVLHSPGPMLYWILAPAAHLGSVASLAVTMGALNTLAIIGSVALARRRGGLVLMFASAAGIALMCRSLPTESLHDIWNPASGLLPFLALIFIAWSVACGDARLLVALALVASYVAQTHLMYLLPTAVLLVVALGGLLAEWLLARRSGRDQRRIWPWALAALLITAGCWTAPIIDELENDPGNMTMIVRTAEHRGPILGARVGWRAVVRSVGVSPWWLYVPASEWQRKVDVRVNPGRGRVDSALAILAALALTIPLAALARRRDLVSAALIALGLCLAIGLQAAFNPSSRLLAQTLGYTMWWGSLLGFWVWLTLAWALWSALLGGWHRTQGLCERLPRLSLSSPAWVRSGAVAAAQVAALGALVAIGDAVAAGGAPDSHVYEYRPIAAEAKAIERVIPPGETISLRLGGLDLGTQPMEPALRFLLVRHGDRVLARGSYPRLGPYYEPLGKLAQWLLYIADGARPHPPMRLVARVRFRSPWGEEVLSAWALRVVSARHSHGIAA